MSTVTIQQAEASLSRLIEMVAAGEEVIIARRGKPVARLVPVGELKGKRTPGSPKGTLQMGFLKASYPPGSDRASHISVCGREKSTVQPRCSLFSRSCSITD
jgi:prevent-host-death family protein